MIFGIVTAISSDNSLTNETSVQAQTFNWLVNGDPLFLCPDDTNAVVQRYVTAVVYLSIGAETNVTDLSPLNECEWPGIVCRGDVVSEIDFEQNLGGTLPTEIGQLSGLNVLDIEVSNLRGTIPETIGLLQNLFVIDLNVNLMTGTLPESIYDLKNLRLLDLDRNNFVGTLSSSIAQLQNLLFLQLEQNSFSGTIPEALGDIVGLEQATFDLNMFTGTMPDSVCDNRGDGEIGGNLVVLNVDCPPQYFCDCCTSGC